MQQSIENQQQVKLIIEQAREESFTDSEKAIYDDFILEAGIKNPAKMSGVLLQGNTSKMFVVASVPLQNIQKVKLGSVANISSSALSKPVSGKVTGVGKLVTTDALGNSYLDVSIKIGNSRQVANMSNLPVRVDIEIPN